MIYNEYGTTGVKVSAIGFGGMRFKDQKNEDECAELVKASYDSGINYFDTAPGYGDSEKLFGIAFKQMLGQRAERPFYVSTKTMKGTPSDVRRDLETSLERMGLDHIDFYHFWCVMSLEAYRTRRDNGVLKEFERLKDEGLVKHIVASSHMQGADIGEMMRDYPFEGILLGYSAMNFAYRTEGITAAADLGRGVVVMNPLGGGIIPQNPERFGFLKRSDDETVVQSALRFLLSDPRITVSLVGLSTREQLREALSALDELKPLDAAAMDEIRAGIRQSFNELCTGCGYCDKCPQEIPVPKFMDGYNHLMLKGKPLDMINRLRWHWGIAPDNDLLDRCTECGACVEACTQKLPVIDRLKATKRELDEFNKAQG